jgi:hypothetical protein
MPTIEIANQESTGVALVTSSKRDLLTGLGERPGADMAARLLQALTALYVQRPTHTVEEQQQYLELALRLVDKVDVATRTAVAAILQRHPDAPPEVLRRLGGMQSSLDDDIEDHTHSSRDQHSVRSPDLAEEERAPIPASSDAVPEVRQSVPATAQIGEAFFAASAVERRRLLSLVTPLASDEVQAASEGDARIDKRLAYERLDVAALHGRFGAFSREFEGLVDIPKSLCERILNDPSGEPMVVAAKAATVPIAILQRILLLVNPAVSHSVRRVYDLTDFYHDLDRGVARALLDLWRAKAKPDDLPSETEAVPVDRKPGALRDSSVASLRSRFGALTERLQTVNARPGPGSVARRGLRSR